MFLTSTGIIIFFLSYLVFPFFIYSAYRANNSLTWMILTVFSIIFIYARFVEPNIIRIKRREIKLNKKIIPFEIAIFSDIHLGIFTKKSFLERVIKKINKIQPDIILIPGDFVWYLPEKKIREKMSALKELSAPAYAVLGNHDCGDIKEKDVSEELEKVLIACGLEVIDNKIKEIKIKEQGIKIIGLSDIETRQPDYGLVKNLTDDDVNMVLAHNPDTVYEFPSYDMDLVVCGHTHGGQVRIYPFYKYAYKYIARMKYNFDKGLKNFRGTKVFITTGVGLGGLPFRFLMPPVIDILEIE